MLRATRKEGEVFTDQEWKEGEEELRIWIDIIMTYFFPPAPGRRKKEEGAPRTCVARHMKE